MIIAILTHSWAFPAVWTHKTSKITRLTPRRHMFCPNSRTIKGSTLSPTGLKVKTQKRAPKKFLPNKKKSKTLIIWWNLLADPVFWRLFFCRSVPPTPPQHTHTGTHTHSPHCVHTSGFPIPATKPHQQGGNDPATTAVMMEPVGGLTCSLALPNKSPNNSVYISADPADRSNAPIRGLSPHARLRLSLRCENCCWPPHSGITVPPAHVQHGSKDRSFGPRSKVCGPTMNQAGTSLIPLSSIHPLTICLTD